MFAPLNLKLSRNTIIILMCGLILSIGIMAFGKGVQASPFPSQLVVFEEFYDDFDGLNLVPPVRPFYTALPIDLTGAQKTSAHSVRPDILHQTGPPQT